MSKRSRRERRRERRKQNGKRRVRMFKRAGDGCFVCGFVMKLGVDGLLCDEHGNPLDRTALRAKLLNR